MKPLFDRTAAGTIGLEEEVLLLEPETLLPAPVAPRFPAFTPELPAAQLELVTRPHETVEAAMEELTGARRALADACAGVAVPAAAALHPTAPAPMDFTPGPRYERTQALHRAAAGLQLIGALQVHVAVGGAERTLAVHNALRSWLPDLGALAAASPFLLGEDTGLASARPLVSGLLPRQGIPPSMTSWEAFAAELEWGERAGIGTSHGRWWWELRPHLTHGTLEIRVPDVQPDLARTRIVVEACVAVVQDLVDRYDRGEALPSHPSWRISENRWAALRDGLDAVLVDLDTAELVPVRERLAAFGIEIPDRTAADDLRDVGVDGAAAWLAAQFL